MGPPHDAHLAGCPQDRQTRATPYPVRETTIAAVRAVRSSAVSRGDRSSAPGGAASTSGADARSSRLGGRSARIRPCWVATAVSTDGLSDDSTHAAPSRLARADATSRGW
jgi:hypothetical protein